MGKRSGTPRQTGYGATKPKNTGYGSYTKEHPAVVPIKKASRKFKKGTKKTA